MASNAASAVIPSSVKHYWGRMQREAAERILTSRGLREGMYLLRDSSSNFGNYAISICFEGRIHHYSVERDSNGMVFIPGGMKFVGPIELLRYHSEFIAGFLTRPSIPCERNHGEVPIMFEGVPMYEMEQRVISLLKAKKLKGQRLEQALGRDKVKYLLEVARKLHESQPWYHGNIDRVEAQRRIGNSGHTNGKFLVRQRHSKSWALTLSYNKGSHHYLIDLSDDGHYSIENGTKFLSLMEMIDCFYSRCEGLKCKLTSPCPHPNYEKIINSGPGGDVVENDVIYSTAIEEQIPDSGLKRTGTNGPLRRRPLPSGEILADPRQRWDDEPEPTPEAAALPPPPEDAEANEGQKDGYSDLIDFDVKIYDSLPRSEDAFHLPRDQLQLLDKLGSGQFGSVMKGIYTGKGLQLHVAVKSLKNTAEQGEKALMTEARTMYGLDHQHIVRMIGVCEAETIMLVLELAPLGQLNKHLKKHQDTPVADILEILYQVASGMSYLESVKFVHRDLAARNVLLVNPTFAKISDFGMSKALNYGNDYYKASQVGKWPLKWYAPECIYYFKFDSKSDVWSYGVTMWEAFTYGGRPYKGMKGQEILQMIEDGGRLLKPDACPDAAFDVMCKCWEYQMKKRPSFSELVPIMRSLFDKENQDRARGGGYRRKQSST